MEDNGSNTLVVTSQCPHFFTVWHIPQLTEATPEGREGGGRRHKDWHGTYVHSSPFMHSSAAVHPQLLLHRLHVMQCNPACAPRSLNVQPSHAMLQKLPKLQAWLPRIQTSFVHNYSTYICMTGARSHGNSHQLPPVWGAVARLAKISVGLHIPVDTDKYLQLPTPPTTHNMC